jgi:hypothetical protein
MNTGVGELGREMAACCAAKEHGFGRPHTAFKWLPDNYSLAPVPCWKNLQRRGLYLAMVLHPLLRYHTVLSQNAGSFPKNILRDMRSSIRILVSQPHTEVV